MPEDIFPREPLAQRLMTMSRVAGVKILRTGDRLDITAPDVPSLRIVNARLSTACAMVGAGLEWIEVTGMCAATAWITSQAPTDAPQKSTT